METLKVSCAHHYSWCIVGRQKSWRSSFAFPIFMWDTFYKVLWIVPESHYHFLVNYKLMFLAPLILFKHLENLCFTSHPWIFSNILLLLLSLSFLSAELLCNSNKPSFTWVYYSSAPVQYYIFDWSPIQKKNHHWMSECIIDGAIL